jgi:exosortase
MDARKLLSSLSPLHVALGAAFASFAWAYGPTFAGLVAAWNRESDNSHGFFVIPLAAYFLYARRDLFPEVTWRIHWAGLGLIALACGVRIAGSLFSLDSLDGWSIPLWLAGVCWLAGGWSLVRWSLPSLAFLYFMVPLPFRIETALSGPLQKMAATASTFLLQVLMQPAIAEGNTILLNGQELEVERACSGLRMFIGTAALAAVYIIVTRRVWWQQVLLAVSLGPIALVANTLRITATGLLFQYASGDFARKFSHDAAGWLMIPLAAAFFAGMLWYLDHVIIRVEHLEDRELIDRKMARA